MRLWNGTNPCASHRSVLDNALRHTGQSLHCRFPGYNIRKKTIPEYQFHLALEIGREDAFAEIFKDFVPAPETPAVELVARDDLPVVHRAVDIDQFALALRAKHVAPPRVRVRNPSHRVLRAPRAAMRRPPSRRSRHAHPRPYPSARAGYPSTRDAVAGITRPAN